MNQHSGPQGNEAHGCSRRSVLQVGAAAAGMAALGTALPLVAQPQSHATPTPRGINVTCWGGAYEKAVRQALADPFTKETGIPVTLVNNADLARMKAQVDSGNVVWDVLDMTGPQIMAGARLGLWAPIDTRIVDTSRLLTPAGKDYVAWYSYAGGIAYDPKKFPDGRHPTTFAEFWDLARFPGRRGLRVRVNETLEMALLADGVPASALYPLDVERGFNALERIKPAVRKWIETTPETVTLVTSNEIDFSYTYLSRVLPAQRAGASVAMSMQQTLNNLDYLAVPRGGRNMKQAMQYVAFCLRPDRQAAYCNLIEFAPNVAGALALVSAEARARMPDMNSPNAVVLNDTWWSEHYEALQRRFTEWLLF